MIRSCVPWGTGAFLLCAAANVDGAIIAVPATDAGFVTAVGGSAKGDGPVAKYNYSVGYELHYSAGAPTPLVAMDRKNYFVFDFSAITEPIISATLKLYAGTLESVAPFETYVLKETPDQPGAVGDAAFLKAAPHPTGFDSPGDMAIAVAGSLYGRIGAGPKILASVDITHADDGTFLLITFTPDGLDHLNGLRVAGGVHLLGGLVTTVAIPDGSPQQPFGFTGPDIPGGSPLTPVLEVTTVPEPSNLALLASFGVATLVRRRKATR